jgi:hypothetical protein
MAARAVRMRYLADRSYRNDPTRPATLARPHMNVRALTPSAPAAHPLLHSPALGRLLRFAHQLRQWLAQSFGEQRRDVQRRLAPSSLVDGMQARPLSLDHSRIERDLAFPLLTLARSSRRRFIAAFASSRS